jgi:diacylglycerol kinase
MKNQPLHHRLRYALNGLRVAWNSERSLRTQIAWLVAVALGLAILRPGAAWTALTLGACATVIAAELFNTALEALADHLHPEQHPRIRVAKDCGAAAVLVTTLGAVITGISLAVHLWRTLP